MAYIYPMYRIVSITSIIMFMLRYSVWHIFIPCIASYLSHLSLCMVPSSMISYMPTVIIINVNAMVPMAPPIVIIISVTAVAQRNSRFSHATLTQPFPVQSRSQLPRTDRDANCADSRHVLMAMQHVLRHPIPNPNSTTIVIPQP